VHGANRLGTNSLLEASLFGRRAGYAIADFIKNGAELHPISDEPGAKARQRVDALLDNPGTESVDKIANELKQTMTDNCGIYREEAKLKVALADIKALQARFKNARVMDKTHRYNTDLLTAIETEHLLNFSEVLVTGALARPESRGAHSRTDFPKRDDTDWLKHTMAHKGDDGRPILSYKSVNIDFDRYPPQERKY
jgi:succinate dehydrogenase / fumarate reductase flavoprotein subunit